MTLHLPYYKITAAVHSRTHAPLRPPVGGTGISPGNRHLHLLMWHKKTSSLAELGPKILFNLGAGFFWGFLFVLTTSTQNLHWENAALLYKWSHSEVLGKVQRNKNTAFWNAGGSKEDSYCYPLSWKEQYGKLDLWLKLRSEKETVSNYLKSCNAKNIY